MKATLYFLVEVEDDYNNYIETANGGKMLVNDSIDSVEHINRVGKLISAPSGTILNEGDFIVFHHNICRRSWGYKGKSRKSVFNIRGNIYYVPVTEIFMYKSPEDKDWSAIHPFTFVKPIEARMETLPNGLQVMEETYKNMKDLVGVMWYPNKELEEQGIKRGDKIAFEEYSQHEYMINGELFYKMKTEDILGVYEGTE